MKWYYINLKYATFGIAEENEIVVKSVPIGKWMIGKNIEYVKYWIKSNG